MPVPRRRPISPVGAMSERPDLALGSAERTKFLADVLADTSSVAYATRGQDGYPEIGMVDARFVDGVIVLDGAEPRDGQMACVIVERGATYDDITAVIARGEIRTRTMPLDDVVSFAFAKLGRRL